MSRLQSPRRGPLSGGWLVTEIPEHLLRRSKERRAALSGEGGARRRPKRRGGRPWPSAARRSGPLGRGARGTRPRCRRRRAVTGAPARRRADARARAPARARPGPGIPLWIMPVLVALPLWGIVYLGRLRLPGQGQRQRPGDARRQPLRPNCSSCHGANGEGGVGPQLNGGEVLKVWPKVADHINVGPHRRGAVRGQDHRRDSTSRSPPTT